eukprot:CAMPEP_0195519818 /NCGR_PEP_ID=MMETSP0794_2-20130614/15572_1 /TAXON_ID=515487 /ORGANISM="Stephanopyxis turris, Strain CCMP 815" /LENGTH=126 /DNA_ID=CAMNT_0040649041 /DNA_START=59 /DNA_END=439 /DNA_ORIENTATION=-
MPGLTKYAVAILLAAAGSTSGCQVGERQQASCDNGVCCKYTNSQERTMTIWSCFQDSKNVTGTQICDKVNGTVIGKGSCDAGELNDQSCSGDASCCCSYTQSNPSGEIDATVCTSSQLCSVLGGSC